MSARQSSARIRSAGARLLGALLPSAVAQAAYCEEVMIATNHGDRCVNHQLYTLWSYCDRDRFCRLDCDYQYVAVNASCV